MNGKQEIHRQITLIELMLKDLNGRVEEENHIRCETLLKQLKDDFTTLEEQLHYTRFR